MRTILITLITLAITFNAKAQEKKELYLLFDKSASNDLQKSIYINSTTISKIPRKYKVTLEDIYLYKLESSFDFPLKFVTKNKCNYVITDSTSIKKLDIKSLKWIKNSNIIRENRNNSLPFNNIYVCEKISTNTYLITEVDLWIGSN